MKKYYPLLIGLLVFVANSFHAQAQEPIVDSYNPVQNATDVNLDVVLKLDFNTNIQFNSTSTATYIKIVETDYPTNEVFSSLIVNGSQFIGEVSTSADTLIISPALNDLSPETQYSVIIDAGAVENADDATPFSGIDDTNLQWRFTTVSRPSLNTLSPLHNATGVTGLQELTLTFEEAVSLGSNKNLSIYKSDGTLFQTINTTADAGLISIATGNYDVSVSHNALTGEQSYYVDVEEGFVVAQSSGVGSAPIDGASKWSFTTDAAPAIFSTSPSGAPSGVHGDKTLILTYAEDVTLQSNKNITIYYNDGTVFQTINTDNTTLVTFDSGTNVLSIDHDRFSGSQSYYINTDEGLVTANDNNTGAKAITGTNTWSFTTASAPIYSIEAPADDATYISADQALIISFSEPVELQANKNLTVFNDDASVFQTINTTSESGLFTFNATNDTVTISHSAFTGSSSYYINIEKALFLSESTAIGTDELTETNNWNFTTANTPYISSFSPDGEADVAGNRLLQLNFSENIALGSNKNLYIHRAGDDQLFQTINTTSDPGFFSVTDTSLEISHDPLWGNTSFYILADEGLAVSATTSVAGEGISDPATWTFSTTNGPAAQSFTPAALSTGVSISAPFQINFNENVSVGTSGNLNIHFSADNTVQESIAFDSGNITTTNDVITVNHSGLQPETDYYITIDPTVVLSSSTGTPWNGISDQSWSFTTATAPTVTGYNPLDEETSAPVNQPLILTFSENIKRGSAGTIQIRKSDDTPFETLTYDDPKLTFSSNELQIDHTSLSSETSYFVKIDNGVIRSAATDVPFAGISDQTTWNFTTAAPPSIDSFTPINQSTLTAADQTISITFNEPIELGSSGSFRIRYGNSNNTRFQTVAVDDTELIDITNNTVTISHLNFTPDTTYFVLIDQGFIKSTNSGVTFSGIQDTTAWTFTAPSGPAISNYEPANGSNDIPVDSELTLTFTENIARGTGNMIVHYQDGSDAVTVGAGSTTNLTISGTTLRFPNLALPHEETVYITMDEGFVISSTTGFAFAGINDPAEWGFTTLPEPPAWANGYPFFSLQTTSTINLDLQTTRDADYYYVITQGSSQPTITEIMSGEKAGGGSALSSGSGTLTANTLLTHENIDISGLATGANYYMHVVAKNPDKELFSSIATIVIDKVAPVTTISPVDGTNHFPESGIIRISFDETIYNDLGNRIDASNINALADLALTSDGSPVSCTITIDTSGTEITVTPDTKLDPVTGYTITMQPVYDHAGNGQSGASAATFSTDKLNIWTGNGNVSDWGDTNNWSTGAFVNNTSIEVPSTVSNFPEVAANLNVYNVNLEPGTALSHSSGTLTVNGEFRLQSSITANASYINTGGNLNVNNDSVKIEQHITGIENTYYLSSPVSGATKSNIGLDNQIFRYNNATDSWVEMGNSENMQPGEGYVGKSSQNLLFSGAVTTGTQVIDLVRSTAGLGWNLIGNPFSASINWDAVSGITKSNIVDAFWIYLDDQGGYGAYNDNSGMSINISDPKIPSNHAFWVKVVEGEPTDTGSVTITPEALEINTNSYLKSTSKTTFPGFKLAGISDAGTDETGVLFIPDASLGNDKYDTDKMKANNPDLLQLFTSDTNNKRLCINGLPDNGNREVSLGYIAGKAGNYTIKMQENYLPANQYLVLEDHLNNVEHNLSQSDYQFIVNAKGTSTDRFTLKVAESVATSINKTPEKQTDRCKVFTQYSKIVIEAPNVQNLRYHLNDLGGRTLETGKLNPGSTHYIDTPNTGIYVVTILSDDGKEQHKVAVE